MKGHMDKARRHLGELGDLAQRTEAAERGILERAEKRHAELVASIERARPGIEGAPDAAQQRYTDMVAERGQLEVVMARARQSLTTA